MKIKNLTRILPFIMVFLCTSVMAQVRIITGTVTDNNGNPVPGAAIQVKETGNGTTADSAGSFKLPVPENGKTLVVSSLDMQEQEVTISGTQMDIILSPGTVGALTDVVVIGYGSVKKTDATGAITTLSTKDFQQGTVTSFDQMISAKAPGVSITPKGGRPGAGSTILVRGLASLSGSNTPLQVVDGAPFDGYVNPNDIETITILKDAASTAIYGSRASSGVVLITTKPGSKGRLKINFNTQVSLAQIPRYVDVLKADEYRNLVIARGDTSAIKLLGKSNTDWQKEIYQSALTSNSNISVAGKAGFMPYRLSAGYLYQQGVLKTDLMQRATTSLKLTPSFFKADLLKVDFNVNASFTKNNNANQDAIGSAVSFDPTQGIRDDSKYSYWGGYFEWVLAPDQPNTQSNSNPVAMLHQRDENDRFNRVFGNLKLDFKIPFLPDLHFIANGGIDHAKKKGSTTIDSLSKLAYSKTDNYTYRGSYHQYSEDFTNTFLEYTLNYVKDIPSIKSNINAMATYGYYDFLKNEQKYASYDSKGKLWPNSTPTFPSTKEQSTIISYVGRLIYTYDDKYTLTASIRRDGSSRFAPDVRWGIFPGISFGWNIFKEKFMENAQTVSDLKLRLSYGKTGNQDGIGHYLYIPGFWLSENVALYELGDSIFYRMYTPSAYDSDLKWETTNSYNAGIDFGFLENRITGSFDVYEKYTTDMLSTVTLPAGANFTNRLTTNIGNMNTKGWELMMNFIPVRNPDNEWNITFNVSNNKSTIQKLPAATDFGVDADGITGSRGLYITYNSQGRTPKSFAVFRQVYDKTTGKPIEGAYEDLNKDGEITPLNDRYFYHSQYPDWLFGFSTSYRYKKFTVSTVLRSNVGNYLYNNIAANLGTYAVYYNNNHLENMSRDVLNTGFNLRQFQSDYYVQNASFLKMDNLGLSYNFGRVFNDKAHLTLSGNIQNVFTITRYKGINPEIGAVDYQFYPVPRVYTLGLNLNF